MARKLIIDTDPGIDDAMAIFYALAADDLDVIGLTTVSGNAHVDVCTANAIRLLDIAGRGDIPVAHGAAKPLAMAYHGAADFVHGVNGLGEVELAPPSREPHVLSAAAFIIEQVMAAPGEITLMPIGPLTNIALAFLMRPELPQYLAGMVIMGGNAFCQGNASPAAEANVMMDPEAADLVLGADCPIVMCGLDVTERTIMSSHQIAALGDIPTARAQFAAQILPFYRDFHVAYGGPDGIFVHDSTCVSYLLAPELYTVEEHPVRVDCGHHVARGRTIAGSRSATGALWEDRRSITVVTNVDSDAAVALEIAHLAKQL